MGWLEDYKNATDWTQIGEGDNPAQNPPPIDEDDRLALRFYTESVGGFVRDFNLMPSLINDLNLDPPTRRILLFKLDTIHNHVLEMRQREQNREIKKASKGNGRR